MPSPTGAVLPPARIYGRYQTSTPRSVGLRVRGSPRGRVTLAQTSSFSIAKREEAIFCFRLHATCRPGCWRGRRVQVWLSDSPLSLLCVGDPAASQNGAFIEIEGSILSRVGRVDGVDFAIFGASQVSQFAPIGDTYIAKQILATTIKRQSASSLHCRAQLLLSPN